MEDYITIPNLPSNDVSFCIIDGRFKNSIKDYFLKLNIEVLFTKEYKSLYNSVAYHPDMLMHHVGGYDIVVAPDIDYSIKEALKLRGFNVIEGRTYIKNKYPYDIAYNVARIGNMALCNIKYTDEIVLQELYKRGIKIVNTKQGYSKCSICIINEKAAITSDEGIESVLKANDIDVLKIKPGYIMLEGLNYGFIGGTCGLIGLNKILFMGNIRFHIDYEKIINFLYKYNIEFMGFSNKLVDIGSIIPLMQYK